MSDKASVFRCSFCTRIFRSSRGLSAHLQHNESHRGATRSVTPMTNLPIKVTNTFDDTDVMELPNSSPTERTLFPAEQRENSSDDESLELSVQFINQSSELDSQESILFSHPNIEYPESEDAAEPISSIVDIHEVGNRGEEHLDPIWMGKFRERKLIAAKWIDNNPGDTQRNVLLDLMTNDLRDISYIPESLAAEIDLMKTLGEDSAQCHTGLFDKLSTYLRRNVRLNPQGKLKENRTKRRILKDLQSVTNLSHMEPKCREIVLPESKMTMDVPVFDFTSVLYDLLTSPNLDFDGSYIFKTENPLDQPATDTMYDDFDSGSRYINSFRMYQKEQNDLPLPIILFVDSANVTGNDRISVEAVMMQLGIHNRDTRYSDKSFRNLGVIPKLSSRFYKGKENGLRKMKDYHAVLDCILSDISLVNKTGLNWVLQWKGKFFNVVLRPYILAILGDYPGHNVICGKMGGNNKISKCRTCVVPNDRLSDTAVFPHIFREDYCGASSIGNDLSAISMHRIQNAIQRIPYGDCDYGVCGLCHGETVHIIQGGIEDRLLEGLQEATLVAIEESKRQSDQFNNECESWYEPSAKRVRIEYSHVVNRTKPVDEAQRRRTLCLGGKTGRRFDAIGTFIGYSLKQQSNRDLPPMPHWKGVTNTNKTTSSEKQGILLLYLLIFCTTFGQNTIAERFGSMNMAYTIEVIELVLCFEELCKDVRGIPRDLLLHWEEFWKKFKPLLCYVTNRISGDGNNLIKLHMIDHLPLVTSMYGSPANISGGPGENNQKTQKAAGRRTQMTETVFPIQQSRKLYEMMVIRSAIGLLENQTSDLNNDGDEGTETYNNLRDPKFDIVHDGTSFNLLWKRAKQYTKHKDHDLSRNSQARNICRYARKRWKATLKEHKLNNSVPPTFFPIQVFTELRTNETGEHVLFRSDCFWQPKVRKEKYLRERTDWALFRWELPVVGSDEHIQKDIPGCMLGFFRKTKETEWFFDDKASSDGTVYVLINSLEQEPDNYFNVQEKQSTDHMAHPASRLVFKGSLEMDDDTPTLPLSLLVPASHIVGTATVIPDLDPVFCNGDNNIETLVQPKDPGHEHLFIRHRRQWSDVIQAVMRDEYSGTETVFPKVDIL